MEHNVYIYILAMALSTYLIRAIPLTLIRKEIKNRFLRSFLHYVPYATLSAMTFPSILTSTGNVYSALAGFAAAVFLAFRKKSLIFVAAGACVVVLATELFMEILSLQY